LIKRHQLFLIAAVVIKPIMKVPTELGQRNSLFVISVKSGFRSFYPHELFTTESPAIN